jgi:glucosylceramidase
MVGQNHVGNFFFAPLHADTVTDELIYTPSYYYWSFLKIYSTEDAKRINSVSSRSQLLTTSFVNEDGKVITVVMNQAIRAV